MNMYLVTFYFENGHNLAVVMASPTAIIAKAEATNNLREAGEPRGNGDTIQYNWQHDETRVELIKFMETERI